MSKPLLAVTMGDPSGAGPEILVKALCEESIWEVARPVAVGDAATIKRAAGIVGSTVEIRAIGDVSEAKSAGETIEVLDLQNVDLETLEYGRVQPAGGEAAYQAVVRAAELALRGEAQAIVTSGLNKEAMNLAGHHFAGHTELLAHICDAKRVAMMLVAGDFRVSHVSTHVSLREAIERVKSDRILEVINLTNDTVELMGVTSPRIGVAGLNPHAGEGGMFGKEEEKEIIPAILAAKQIGIQAFGPVPPDTVFFNMTQGRYDAVVAMYHDQGHIPTKVLSFDEGVNVTLGLPIIRTSVDHGTVFGKAGKGTARPESMIQALKLAAKMAASRA